MMPRLSNSAAAALLLLAACTTPQPGDEAVVVVDAPVEVVRSSTVPATRAVAGSVRSRTVSPLAARVAGSVTSVYVSIGDRVRAGQILVEIDDREARAARGAASSTVDAARANATLASATFDRFATLRERGSASVQEFDDARARRDAALADLERAQRADAQASTFLAHSTVRSPMDGVVTARFVDPGAHAAPGVPLVTVEDAAAFRVDAAVDESVTVRAGDPVVVRSGEETIAGRVAHVRPAVDAVTRSALVEIDVPRALRSGTHVNVLFQTGSRKAITVPAGAVSRRGQLTSVFAVGSDGIARMRLVRAGETVSGRTEILSGLADGETIVSARTLDMHDGARVRRAS